MLTPSQQKIRQELEELQVNGLFVTNKDPISTGKKERSRRVYYLGILFVFLLGCFLSYKVVVTRKQPNIEHYLTKVETYNSKSSHLIQSFLHHSQVLNQPAREEQQELVDEAKNMAPPSGFSSFQQDWVELMTKREYVLSTDAVTQSDLLELTVKEELAAGSFENALIDQHIKHKALGNGRFQYWLNAKSYMYGK